VEYGRGDDRTNLLRIAVVDKWRKSQAPDPPEWRLAGYWEVSAALWDNRDESTADVGFAPVFRIERRSIYLEAALGFHLVQAHISAGIRTGRNQFGLHAQHLSNGALNRPNPGINFLLVRLQYDLE